MRIGHINPVPIVKVELEQEEILEGGVTRRTYSLTTGNGQLHSLEYIANVAAVIGLTKGQHQIKIVNWRSERCATYAVKLDDTGKIVEENPINPRTGAPYAPSPVQFIVTRFSVETQEG